MDGAVAILATHVFGAPCPVAALEELAQAAAVPLVFDAAHAFGATRAGRSVGGFGDAEVFSLSPTKLVVAGEGGLVATNREDLARELRIGRDYGNPGNYDTQFVGLNARMSEMHAATAIESLARLDDHLERRQRVSGLYAKLLAGVPGIATQVVDEEDCSTYKDFTIFVDEERFGLPRDAVVAALKAEGIDTRCYFSPPVHRQHAYAGHGVVDDLPVTDRVAAGVISLPIFAELPLESVELVAEVLVGLGERAGEVRAKAC
jgi:dTDP-4-amino-4,6-dideoxygalactose transaminase